MQLTTALLASSTLAGLASAADTVVGVFILSRHGDRTAKALGNTALTDLGYAEVFQSGQWYRENYFADGAALQVAGVSANTFAYSQVSVSAPYDDVLMPSSLGFMQGVYPPVGATLGSQTLANGSTVEAPNGGFQLVPVQSLTTGSGGESSGWLQGSTGCEAATISSNDYFNSDEYLTLLNSTQSFYTSLAPVINRTFTPAQMSFENAYTIFDLINVAEIHNSTIPSSGLLTDEVLFQLRTLADNHEFNLAYNASSPVRAIAGATFAASVVQQLNATITSQGKSKAGIQFGNYAVFQSFFGLANMTVSNANLTGLVNYASTGIFELFTNASYSTFPATDDLYVRFKLANGTASNASAPAILPLFGGSDDAVAWDTFTTEMSKFSIGTQAAWCTACGNTTGICAPTTASSTGTSASASASASGSSSGGGISKAVAGIIGAMVTLGVILLVEIIAIVAAVAMGMRVVRKARGTGAGADATASGAVASSEEASGANGKEARTA